MKRLVNTFLLVMLSVPTSLSGIMLTKSSHLPRVGDEYTKQRLNAVSVGNGGENVVWDFRDATIADGNHKVRYIQLPDSCIGVIEDKTCMRYLVRGDSLLWGGYENRTTFLEDSISAIAMKFPVKHGDQIKKSFYLQGRYSTSEKIVSYGESEVSCDGYGILYLPDGDSIKQVLRIHLRQRSVVDMNDSAERMSVSDSISKDIVIKERNRYYWYSSEYRYPLMEIMEDNYFSGDSQKPYSTIKTAYMCSRSEQDYLHQNDSDVLLVRQQTNKDQYNEDFTFKRSESLSIPEDLKVSTEGGVVNVIYTSPEVQEGLEIILSDIQGRIYSSERINSVQGINRYVIEGADLPTGEYLLYVRKSGIIKVIRFRIK